MPDAMRCLPWSALPGRTIWTPPISLSDPPPAIEVLLAPGPAAGRPRRGSMHQPRRRQPILAAEPSATLTRSIPRRRAPVAAEPSATLREQLIAEVRELKSRDELALWAYRRLPAKNSLTADDARIVEANYQSALDAVNRDGPTDLVADPAASPGSTDSETRAGSPLVRTVKRQSRRCAKRCGGEARHISPLSQPSRVWSAGVHRARII
jgi:hypothetical protein